MTRTRITVAMFAWMLLVIAGMFGAAAVVYDRQSRVAADCDERFGGNDPAHWTVRGIDLAVPDFDGQPWFVDGYQEVRIAGRDPGIELRAWWMAPDEAAAPSVVVVHGFGTCMRDPVALAPAGMLHRLGYGVLMIDLRDHGGSTIEDGRTAGGTEEYRDVLGAVDWLVAEGAEPGRIGLLGTSMGAAASIIAAGHDDRIAAVWADSSYADLLGRIGDGLEDEGLPRWLAPIVLPVAQLMSGDDLGSPSVLVEIASLRGRHFAVIHGALDGLIDVSHAETLAGEARTAGVITERWVVSDAGHVDAVFVHPEDYERRLADFFDAAFGTGRPLKG